MMCYLPEVQRVYAGLLLSRPCMCVCVRECVCLVGRGGCWSFCLILTCAHSPDPTDASLHTFSLPLSLFCPIVFAPAPVASPSLNPFPLPSQLSHCCCLFVSPFLGSFLLRILHSVPLWLVRTLPLLLPHALSDPA